MITGIHHVGIAVRSLEEAYRFYRDALGLPVMAEADVPEQGVRAALLAAGETEIELLEPLGAQSGMAKFLERRGEGFHHVCFETSDVAQELAAAREKGAELIDATPRAGLAGRIGFFHPRACAGVLVELATVVAGAGAHARASGAAPLRFRALTLGAKDPRATAAVFQRLFGFPERRAAHATHVALDVGRTAMEIVPSADAGGVEGMTAITLAAADVERARAAIAGARTTHGAALHITRDE